MSDEQKVSILSIDAWGNADDGFEWNAWYKIGECDPEIASRKPAEIIEYLIGEGILSDMARTLLREHLIKIAIATRTEEG